jgi:hypothetical protein
MPDEPLLKNGSRDPKDVKGYVTLWQSLMQSQGCYTGRVDGFFGSRTTAATRYFQMTHLDSKGKPLEVDGEVGKETWWAGHNPSGEAQRSHIKPKTPAGISAARRTVLAIAQKEHALGTKEIPDGSNWGDGVIKLLEGVGPNPWCCFFVWWVWKEAFGKYLWDTRHGHVQTVWRVAKANGCAHLKDKYIPIPGDMFVLLYKNTYGNYSGTGHIGYVLSVAPDGQSFNTLEGNAGNRVKVGLRSLSESSLVGFINPYKDDASSNVYEMVILEAEDVVNDSTR